MSPVAELESSPFLLDSIDASQLQLVHFLMRMTKMCKMRHFLSMKVAQAPQGLLDAENGIGRLVQDDISSSD